MSADLRDALDWLSELVHDGTGAYELCVTEEGDIGLFKHGNENCLGRGDNVSSAIIHAWRRRT